MKKTSITNLLIVIFILALGACSTDPGTISGTTTETVCTDGLDDDGDGSIDCDDSDCDVDTTNCPSGDLGENNDDDGDNYTENAGDCDDSDGTINPGATETVGDGIDQDCDGSDSSSVSSNLNDADDDGYYSGTEATEDCDDGNSAINPAATEVLEDGLVDENCDDFILQATETDCTDGVDNDGDTLMDCTDADCNADSACDSSTDVTETACTDGADNDGDTYADCSDSDCSADTSCATTTTLSLSTTDFDYSYDPIDGTVGMRWVSASGSNYQADGTTANDCATVTTPCADLTAALANVAAGERIGVFEGTYEYTADFLLTQAAFIDGGYYWETADTVLAANSRTHASTLEFDGASFVVRAPGKRITITGLGFIGDAYPAVLQIVNSSPVFASCRIRAGSGVIIGQAVNIRSTGFGLMRPTFLNSQITVGAVSGVSSFHSMATAINAVNLSTTTGKLFLVLRGSDISVGRVSVDDPTTYTANSSGISIQGSTTAGTATVLILWKNDLALGASQNSYAVVGSHLSAATITGNSIIVRGGLGETKGILMTSAQVGTETLDITGNLISLNKTATVAQTSNTGILANEFATTITNNTLIQGLATDSIGVSVDNSTNSQALSMTNNFLQSNGMTSSTMIALTGVPTSLNLSYNGFHFATASATQFVFSDGTDTFATVVDLYGDGITTGLFGAYATPTVTGNLDITADPLYWLGQRMVLDLVLNANAALIIDKGDSTLTVSATARDINGKARFVDGDDADGDSDATTGAVIDMGAAEAQ